MRYDEHREKCGLVADVEDGVRVLQRLLEDSTEVVAATSVAEALSTVNDSIDLKVCGIHFDGSRNCPCCELDNKDRARVAYSRDAWNLKECGECGLLYLENALPCEALSYESAWERTSAREATRRSRSRVFRNAGSVAARRIRLLWRRDKLGRLVDQYVRGGNVLDIGCGAGAFFSRLPDRYVPYGIEISATLSQLAQRLVLERGGNVIRCDAVSGVRSFPDDYFSGILMSSFLEHEINPLPLLKECLRILAPEAVVIVKVPNFASLNRSLFGAEWCGFRFPDHVNYFTPGTLRELCKRAGLDVIRFRWIDRHPFSDNMWAVLQKRSALMAGNI